MFTNRSTKLKRFNNGRREREILGMQLIKVNYGDVIRVKARVTNKLHRYREGGSNIRVAIDYIMESVGLSGFGS